ncbi:DUF2063 domain-containing protein [Falsihalocynthiibacter sp. BN13B15]|uniref:HvfC/BufC N-terminal domain-containing protein n=1 Tax=Falsihalocynthiibacter sp. BN13B15 TaxID=3240871 RepID=UPI0035109B0E
MVTVSQTQFIHALLDPDTPPPEGLIGPDGSPAGKRFSVYRNNVAVSLTEALGQAFPVLCRIVGQEFFDAVAGVYLRAHPPRSPLMMFYGAEMPAFLAKFEPVAHLPYLPDVARLELALRASYHAADAPPIAAETLQSISPDALMAARLTLAPAVKILRSPWPLHAIYLVNTRSDAPSVTPSAQDVLLTRPDFDPEATLLPAGGADFIETLGKNMTFGAAFEAASTIPEFDLTTVLGALLAGGAITHIDLI